jgi:DNA-binding NarL/FixJ family response regulator
VELVAVRALNNEGLVTNPAWMQSLASNRVVNSVDDPELIEALTGREMEILQLLALGLTNKQIALRLGISAHTVKFHLSSIFNKMGTTNRTETVKLGLRMGYILL